MSSYQKLYPKGFKECIECGAKISVWAKRCHEHSRFQRTHSTTGKGIKKTDGVEEAVDVAMLNMGKIPMPKLAEKTWWGMMKECR